MPTVLSQKRLTLCGVNLFWDKTVSNDQEKIDPKNGFILSPLFDKLFDRGFITFTPDRRVKITNWLSNYDKKHINISDNQQIPILPIDDERIKYLQYHSDFVFKG